MPTKHGWLKLIIPFKGLQGMLNVCSSALVEPFMHSLSLAELFSFAPSEGGFLIVHQFMK